MCRPLHDTHKTTLHTFFFPGRAAKARKQWEHSQNGRPLRKAATLLNASYRLSDNTRDEGNPVFWPLQRWFSHRRREDRGSSSEQRGSCKVTSAEKCLNCTTVLQSLIFTASSQVVFFQVTLKVQKRASLWKPVPCLLDQLWMEIHLEETANVTCVLFRLWKEKLTSVLCYSVTIFLCDAQGPTSYEPAYFLSRQSHLNTVRFKTCISLLCVEKALDGLQHKYSYKMIQDLIPGSLFVRELVYIKYRELKNKINWHDKSLKMWNLAQFTWIQVTFSPRSTALIFRKTVLIG